MRADRMNGKAQADRALLITGKSKSGKTSLARAVQRQYPRGLIVPMAMYLKHYAREIGWNGIKDDRGVKLLQEFGMVFRDYDPDIWVRHSLEEWVITTGNYDLFIADDIRFPNEVHRISGFFGIEYTTVVRMERDGNGLEGELATHASEQEFLQIKPDFVITNDGDLKELEVEAGKLLSVMGLPVVKGVSYGY